MEVSQFLLLTVFVLMLGLVGLVFIGEKHRVTFSLLVILTNAILSSIPAVLALLGTPQTGTIVLAHFPDKLIDVRIDSLSAWFILIINFTTLNGAIFGTGYLKSYQHLKTNLMLHWVFYLVFHISMVWVCMFDNGLFFIISWELMLISSLMLIIFEYTNTKNLRAGLKYLINMHISVVLITVGFIWIFVETGSFNLSALANVYVHQHALWIFILLFVGFAIKAGFVPFHTWLPDADSTAPSHVGGVMSGALVKLGIFGILRIVSTLQYDLLIMGEVILSVSVLSALYGILNAALKNDFNRSLAYCSMENIGIIGMGIGLGLIGMATTQPVLYLLGFSSALLHVFNHSLYKSLLFFSTGSLYTQTGTRNIEKLGGLLKPMPITAIFFLIGALSIGGLPPFNGFVSEFLIYMGLFKGLFLIKGISHVLLIILSIGGLVLVGGISIITFSKLFSLLFLGETRSAFKKKPTEVSFAMHLPQYLIVVAIMTVALFPKFYLAQVAQIVEATFHPAFAIEPELFGGISTNLEEVSRVSMGFVLLVASLFLFKTLWNRKKSQTVYETWRCGYVTAVPKAQYSSRSYVNNLGILFSFLAKTHKSYTDIPKGSLYPNYRKFSVYYFDFFELYLVKPLLKSISWFLNYFQFIQNGRVQSYVVYSLIFILIVFIGTAIGLII